MRLNSLIKQILIGAAIVLFGGCGSTGEADVRELTTASDHTESQKRAYIRLQLAVGYFQQGQLSTALDELKQALQIDPNLADAYNVRASIYMEMGETKLAEDNFLHALKLAPQNPDLANNYGWFLCQNGRERQAIGYFETALKSRFYQSPPTALNNAGLCSLKIKDVAAAERYLMEAFQYDAGNPNTNTNLAKLFYERQDFQRANFYISRVMKSSRPSADALWTGIKVHRKLGDRTAENSLATQLRRTYPNSKEFSAYARGAFNE
jgi:type IV pilus assembly protein PilF